MDREKQYRHYCFIYGVMSLVWLMEEYAIEENYEECQTILNSINGLSEKFETPMPTKWNEDSINWFKEQMKYSANKGEIALQNIPFYAFEIRVKMTTNPQITIEY